MCGVKHTSDVIGQTVFRVARIFRITKVFGVFRVFGVFWVLGVIGSSGS